MSLAQEFASDQVKVVNTEIRFDRAPEGDCIRVPVAIGGKDGFFLLDTGTTNSVIDKTFEPNCHSFLGDRVAQSAGSKTFIRMFNSIRILSFGVDREISPVATTDLRSIKQIFGKRLFGVVGTDYIGESRIGYDDGRSMFFIGNSLVRRYEKTEQLHRDGSGRLHTKDVFIDGARVNRQNLFLIDTGMNNALCVDEDYFDMLVEVGRITDVTSQPTVSIGNAIEEHKQGFLDWAVVWGERFETIPISQSSRSKIGLSLLRKFSFRLRFDDSTIELTPGRNKIVSQVQSGLSLACLDDQIVIDRVDLKSSNSTPQILAGDVLVSVGGILADSDNIAFIRESLATASQTNIELQLARGNSSFTSRLSVNCGKEQEKREGESVGTHHNPD